MKLAFIVCARANETSVLPVVEMALDDGHRCTIIRMASALLDRYGAGSNPTPAGASVVRLHSHVEGDMAATAGLTATKLIGALETCAPDWVYLVGDRHEVLGAAIAASYGGWKIAHQMGGETSGNLDDRVRDAVTALADLHLAASARAYARLRELVREERQERVYMTGCPRIDLVKRALDSPPLDWAPSVLVALHPETELSAEENATQARQVLAAAGSLGLDVRVILPNADEGTNAVAAAIRAAPGVLTHRLLGALDYARAMRDCAVMVGNSSSMIREGAFIGTPCVLVGNRQRGRERDQNVWEASTDELATALQRQRDHGHYPESRLYGDGDAARHIVDALAHG